ncbi:PH domain-containing protein [Streptomyces sp. NPDC014894]|uniref:PH domain-containing protein n=1 Tax=Streptomyces sp. NPDC014894 TaxID=3364931 RepID=UPI0036F5C23F
MPGSPGDGWRRIDRKALLVTGLVMGSVAAGLCLPILLGLSGGEWPGPRARQGAGLLLLLGGAALLVLVPVAAEYVSWLKTRYRVGPDRVELHTGLLFAKRRSLARERVRTVDLTANPLLRVLGLVKVRIGTGEQAAARESTLVLDPVSRAEGERLRAELLGRAAPAGPGVHREGVLAVIDLRWIRYAPLSFVAPLLGGAAAGAVMQISDWFGVQHELIVWIGDRFRDTSVTVMVLVLAAAAAVAGVVGSLGLWVEMWWNHRLEREPGGTLRVRRGLFTVRSISVEERRLRGVELVEPLGVRLAGAARVDAVATGIGRDGQDQHADLQILLPPAPRAHADAVAARVLREPLSPTNAPLTPHPAAARSRRLRWAAAAVLGPLAVLVALGLWLTPVLLYIALGWTAAATPVALLLGLDAYRSLGHTLSGDYLVARSGTARRSTVALQRTGVIGWVVRQSVFQRRARVLTLTATTAAGSGAYSVYDADADEGLDFAADAVPDLLRPFLEPRPEPRSDPAAPEGS